MNIWINKIITKIVGKKDLRISKILARSMIHYFSLFVFGKEQKLQKKIPQTQHLYESRNHFICGHFRQHHSYLQHKLFLLNSLKFLLLFILKMCINPQLKIVPGKSSIYCSLSDVCPQLQHLLVLENCPALLEIKLQLHL